MTRAQTTFIIAMLLCSATIAAAGQDVLASAEKTYRTKLAGIDHKHIETLALAIRRYQKDLEAYSALSKRAGDLDAALAARKETERYSREKTIPEESAPDFAVPLVLARTRYHETVAQAQTDQHKSILALVEQYTTYLTSLEKKLVSSDKLNEAMAVRKAIDEVESSAPVTAARFALADASAKAAGSAETNSEPPAATAEPEYETIEYTKKIGARGGLMHDWSSTTLRLQEGDEISVKATGSWQCTYEPKACGPAGYPYSNPTARQFRRDPTLNYGALICKCGSKGPVIHVGEAAKFTSDVGGVLLYFDANVLPGRTHRRDCAGDLVVNVSVKRKKQ